MFDSFLALYYHLCYGYYLLSLKKSSFVPTRLGNLIKRLDEDDVDFLLQTALDTENKVAVQYDQDREAIEEYRKAAGTDGPLEETLTVDAAVKEIASITKRNVSSVTTATPSSTSVNATSRKSSIAAKQKALLDGIVRKRKSIDSPAQQEVLKKALLSAKATRGGSNVKSAPTKETPRASDSRSPVPKVGLNLLAAYDSDDDDDDV